MPTQRRTVLRSTIAAATAGAITMATAAAAPAALASDTWCDVDPIQLVITSGGTLVPIFVTNGARSLLYLPQLLLARITHTVTSVDGGTASLVTVSVTVPSGLLGRTFATRSVVSSGPLGLLSLFATTMGTSGSPMTIQFTLNVGLGPPCPGCPRACPSSGPTVGEQPPTRCYRQVRPPRLTPTSPLRTPKARAAPTSAANET